MAEELAKPEPHVDVDSAKPDPQPIIAVDTPLLRIDAVVKKFGALRAVDRLSLEIRAGEFFALLGPSGCGKTTLLRMLAGFETPDEGRILLDGKDIARVLPHQRPVNMMFQNYALFPHLSVRDNIAFGLKRAGMPRSKIDARVAELVALVRLEGLEKRRPDQLSGGQKQRVALARSLARRPQVLLLDEPLAALDKKLRESTQAELKEVQRRLGMTFIIVTHDQEEAMTVADRIGVMDNGRLEQVATPRQLYEAPNSRWIAEFVGDVNIFEGQILEGQVARRGRSAGDFDAQRRHHRGRRAAPTGHQNHRLRRDPPRKGQAVAARPGVGRGQCACDQPAGRRRHRRRLSRRSHHLQGQARHRRDVAFVDGQHGAARHRCLQRRPARGGVVHPRRLRGAGSMSARHIFARPARLAAIAPYLWMALFFLVPFGFVLKISLSQTAIAQPPYLPVFDLTQGLAAIRAAFAALSLDNFRLLVSDDLYVLSYLRSLVVAAVSTSILLLIGYPIAYGMARLPQRWQPIAMMLVIVPFWTSFLIRIYAWINILQHDGLLNKVLLALHLVAAPVVWLSTDSAMYLGIVYSYLPFMILPLYATLARMDPALLEAAGDLGASPRRAFWLVTFPLSWPGVAAGVLLCFIPIVGEFVIPDLLAGSDSLMIGQTLWLEFFTNKDWPVASAAAAGAACWYCCWRRWRSTTGCGAASSKAAG